MDPLPRVHLQCASIVMVGVAAWVGPRTIHVCTWACFDEVGSLLSVGLGPTKGFRVLLRGSEYYYASQVEVDVFAGVVIDTIHTQGLR